MEEYAREPCPYRIVDDCGGAFAMVIKIELKFSKFDNPKLFAWISS
jgi:hypothetical protein